MFIGSCVGIPLYLCRLGSGEARQRLPRVLQLLGSTEDALYGRLEQEFIAMAQQQPSWMFIAWIPQMVALLDKREGEAIGAVLVEIAKQFVAPYCCFIA